MNDSQLSALAVESSGSSLKVGLSLPDGRIMTNSSDDRFRHAEFIFPLIDELLAGNSVAKKNLELIIIGLGPGSFTGLRVGMAAAKGLAVSLGLPLVGLSTMAAIGRRLYEEHGRTAVVILSRRNEFYFGLAEAAEFRDETIRLATADDIAGLPEEIKILAVDFDPGILNLPEERIIPAEKFMVKIEDFIVRGIELFGRRGGDNPADLNPLYIQKFPVGVKK